MASEEKSFEKPLQMKTAYGLNEKVIASPVSKSRKGYSTKDKIFKFPESVFFFFFSLSRDNAGCQVKNKSFENVNGRTTDEK